jgi:hypothetical protein
MKTIIQLILPIYLLLIANLNVSAVTVQIPADYPSIQEGINAAMDGDSVIVAPGTWYENLSISGKNIILGSWFLTTGDSTYISETILDGNHSGRVLNISGVSAPARICGFIIKNGSSTSGSGIQIVNSSLTIDNVLITDNIANCAYSGICQGAGVACSGSSLTLSDFRFINNNAICQTPPINPEGGAINARNSELYLNSGEIKNNNAWLGGGLYLADASCNIAQVEFSGNQSQFLGAGICSFSSELNIAESIFRNNMGNEAIYSDYSGSIILTNCLFTGHSKSVIQSRNPTLTLINCTLTGNSGYTPISCASGSELTVMNSILWNDADYEVMFFSGQNSHLYLGNNTIRNGLNAVTTGPAIHVFGPVFNTNPLFADSVYYHLSNQSPCIGVGLDTLTTYPFIAAPLIDLAMNPRPMPAGSLPDLGAYEHELSDPVISTSNYTINDYDFTIYPNPASDYLIIKSNNQLPILKISLIDLSGRIIFVTNNLQTESLFQINTSSYNLKGLIIVEIISSGKVFRKGLVIL